VVVFTLLANECNCCSMEDLNWLRSIHTYDRQTMEQRNMPPMKTQRHL
jgi:hypothetical protein